jgi:hypothetical protein
MQTDNSTTNTPFRAQLWLEIMQPQDPSYLHRRYLVWASPFTHADVHKGFEFLAHVFTAERFEAIILDLQKQSARIDQILADLVRDKQEEK